jgi:hypothetical protein
MHYYMSGFQDWKEQKNSWYNEVSQDQILFILYL